MSNKDGGPAFPARIIVGQHVESIDGINQMVDEYAVVSGMTLRDYFAAHYLAGIDANVGANDYCAATNAEIAYKHADAMLKEREK